MALLPLGNLEEVIHMYILLVFKLLPGVSSSSEIHVKCKFWVRPKAALQTFYPP